MSSPRSALRTVAGSAFAAALRAKCGTITLLDLDSLRAEAEALLPADHPLRRAVTEFASRCEEDRYFAAQVIARGDELARAVEHALLKAPPDMGRIDIHG